MSPSTSIGLYWHMIVFVWSFFCILKNVPAYAKVDVQVNPGCIAQSFNCSQPWLIDVVNIPTSASNETSYHHLWGGVGAPTIMTVMTDPVTNFTINWEKLIKHEAKSVTADLKPLNIFGMSITEMILFDDQNDTGSIASVPADARLSVPVNLFQWNYTLKQTSDSADLTLYTTTFDGKPLLDGSGIYIKMDTSSFNSRGVSPPRLLATPGSATVDLVLDRLLLNVTNPHPSKGPVRSHNHHRVDPISGFTSPRWAVRLVVFSSELRGTANSEGMKREVKRSIDDEYSPGVFELDDVTTPYSRQHVSSVEGGYLQWRPICYLSEARSVSLSTLPTLSSPDDGLAFYSDSSSDTAGVSDSRRATAAPSFFQRLTYDEYKSEFLPLTDISEPLRSSLAYALFGEDLKKEVLAVQTLVSFGAPGDGFYTSSDYTVWTYTVGSGSPSQEGLSTNVLIVILVGLGLPLVALIGSAITLVMWRCRLRKDSDQRSGLLEEEVPQ